MRNTLFIVLCILYLNSCSLLKAQDQTQDLTGVMEPFITPPPKLTDYINAYGKTDGIKLYYDYLKDYILHLSFFKEHLNNKYNLEQEVTVDGCAFKPDIKTFTLPDLPSNLNTLSEIEVMDALLDYISEVEESVERYNDSVLKQIEEYERCNL